MGNLSLNSDEIITAPCLEKDGLWRWHLYHTGNPENDLETSKGHINRSDCLDEVLEIQLEKKIPRSYPKEALCI